MPMMERRDGRSHDRPVGPAAARRHTPRRRPGRRCPHGVCSMSNDNAEIFDPLLNCLQHFQDATHFATTEVAILRAVVRERYLDFLERVHQAQVSLR